MKRRSEPAVSERAVSKYDAWNHYVLIAVVLFGALLYAAMVWAGMNEFKSRLFNRSKNNPRRRTNPARRSWVREKQGKPKSSGFD